MTGLLVLDQSTMVRYSHAMRRMASLVPWPAGPRRPCGPGQAVADLAASAGADWRVTRRTRARGVRHAPSSPPSNRAPARSRQRAATRAGQADSCASQAVGDRVLTRRGSDPPGVHRVLVRCWPPQRGVVAGCLAPVLPDESALWSMRKRPRSAPARPVDRLASRIWRDALGRTAPRRARRHPSSPLARAAPRGRVQVPAAATIHTRGRARGPMGSATPSAGGEDHDVGRWGAWGGVSRTRWSGPRAGGRRR